MKHSFDRSFIFKFNEDSWEAYLITPEEFVELYEKVFPDEEPETSAGFVHFKDKCIFISEGYVDKETVAHELFHMVVDYFHLSSADITVDQFEEIIAVWLETNVDKFVKTRNTLTARFKKLEEAGK